MAKRRILYIEPFNGGSHAAFTRTLTEGVDAEWTVLTLPGRHWKWRARGSAAYFALAHRELLEAPYDCLVASSYLPLTDLLAFVPKLSRVPSVLYFHENQLAYPSRTGTTAPRDHHFGFSQLTSALAATRCVFNSDWNRRSFLEAGATLLSRMPDAKPPGFIEQIAAKCEVLPVPLKLEERPLLEPVLDEDARRLGPIILWNHRWEYDKDPVAFFEACRRLRSAGRPFRLAVCGQRFKQAPPIFATAKAAFEQQTVQWGHLPSRDAYLALLNRCHIAVSTAQHEFFGIAMLEATHAGCRPVVPNRLAYPEIFPSRYRYDSADALHETLVALCDRFAAGESLRDDRRALTRPFGSALLSRYQSTLWAL